MQQTSDVPRVSRLTIFVKTSNVRPSKRITRALEYEDTLSIHRAILEV